jgi:hypothetical protein
VNKRDVIVTKDNPLYVTDNDRTFGTVTILPGGQVFIQTSALVSIDTLVKQPGSVAARPA